MALASGQAMSMIQVHEEQRSKERAEEREKEAQREHERKIEKERLLAEAERAARKGGVLS